MDNAEKEEHPPPIESFRKKESPFCKVGFSPDGRFAGIQLSGNGSILYDLKNFKIVDMHRSHPCCGNFYAGPSQSRWIMEKKERDIFLIDRVTGKEAARYPGPFEHVISSPANPAVFAVYKGRRVEIFSVSED